ncbi:hypothetical protein [Prosthecobacter sp.]|uniref:hypothetical protein n=1 Tax=Prosthecobacter sp. TaxID=1965333 RepID=UPI003784CE79
MLALTGPISPEIIAAVGAAVCLPPLILWLVMSSKLKRQAGESAAILEKLRAESDAALQAVQARAAADAAEHARASATAAASLADLQQRFSTHREVSERRANDASQQITRLEAELASTREIAAQLGPTQSRIKDLETALVAEQGRVKAQEQAIEATNARAADFEKRMLDAKEMVLKHKMEMQETAVELKKIRDEQAAYAAAGGPEAELAKAREAAQQAETKVANLQRALKAAEARTEMVQKEFMNAVGLATAPTPGAPSATSDKKLRELEEKLTHVEAESRKRAREDGYKIAELEYRLSEALETAKTAKAALASPGLPSTLAPVSPSSEPAAPPEAAVPPAPVAEANSPGSPEELPPAESVLASPTADLHSQEPPQGEPAAPQSPAPASPAAEPTLLDPLPQVTESLPSPNALGAESPLPGSSELAPLS